MAGSDKDRARVPSGGAISETVSRVLAAADVAAPPWSHYVILPGGW